jgi:hypothetical protein
MEFLSPPGGPLLDDDEDVPSFKLHRSVMPRPEDTHESRQHRQALFDEYVHLSELLGESSTGIPSTYPLAALQVLVNRYRKDFERLQQQQQQWQGPSVQQEQHFYSEHQQPIGRNVENGYPQEQYMPYGENAYDEKMQAYHLPYNANAMPSRAPTRQRSQSILFRAPPPPPPQQQHQQLAGLSNFPPLPPVPSHLEPYRLDQIEGYDRYRPEKRRITPPPKDGHHFTLALPPQVVQSFVESMLDTLSQSEGEAFAEQLVASILQKNNINQLIFDIDTKQVYFPERN